MNVFKPLLPLLIFIVIIGVLARGLWLHPTALPSPLIGKPAPAFALDNLVGTSPARSPADFLGKITLVNVWATWCYACAEEHPLLMKLAHQKEYVLYGYNYKDDSAAALQWLRENGNPYQTVAIDPDGKMAIEWGVYGTPETFLIDKKGIVRYKLIGAITEENWREILLPLIKKLRNEP